MQIGFSAANITPSSGMRRPGGMGESYNTWKHDDCWASAAVFDDGDKRVALVGIDSLSVKRSVCDEARAIIEEACGIPADNVMFGASHTHAAGPCCNLFITEADPVYIKHMARQMASAVISADHLKRDAMLGVGTGECRGVAHHRRWILKDGRQWSHPRAMPELMDHPQGELDESVNVIGVSDADGTLRGAVVNFTCHGTTGMGAGGTSSDWIHAMRRGLKNEYGEDFGVVFMQGACGDITQVDNTQPPDVPMSGPAVATGIGAGVAGEAIKLLARMSFVESAPLAASRKLIHLTPRQPTDEQLAWARAHLDSDEPTPSWWSNEGFWSMSWLDLDAQNKIEPEVPCELQAISIGRTVYASNPGEFFCKLGNDIKKRSQFDNTFIAELANGCIGYVPTEDAYEGGYESSMCLSSKMAPGNGEIIVDETVELLESMTVPEDAGV